MVDVKPDYTLSITYKMPENPETHAKLFVALKGETANYKTVNIPNEGKAGQWVTFTAKMSDLGLAADATVAMIGLKFENTPANYKMLVGEMALRNPAQTFNTKKPTVAEVQVLRGRYNAFDFKMRYYSDDGTGTTKTYNDDVDTWYYEIYVQPKNGNAQMLTATTSWAAYVVDAPVSSDKDNRMMRMGVRAVSPDGLHHSDIAWSDWTNVAYDQPLHTAKLNKSVIKPGEPFVVSLEDLINAGKLFVQATTKPCLALKTPLAATLQLTKLAFTTLSWLIPKAKSTTIVALFKSHPKALAPCLTSKLSLLASKRWIKKSK